MVLEPDLETIAAVVGGTLAASVVVGVASQYVSPAINVAVSYWREKHPSQPRAIIIDPRSGFERFMNGLDYYRRNCPDIERGLFPNTHSLNPDNLFGRFATRNGYFRLEKKE